MNTCISARLQNEYPLSNEKGFGKYSYICHALSILGRRSILRVKYPFELTQPQKIYIMEKAKKIIELVILVGKAVKTVIDAIEDQNKK